MKTSAMMLIPRNIQKSVTQYMMASKYGFIVVIPGKKAQLNVVKGISFC